MLNYKQKWHEFTDWKGWKCIYWVLTTFLLIIIFSIFVDIFKLLKQSTEERIANGGLLTSDEVECCWDYISKNIAIFNLLFLIISYSVSLFFSFTQKRNYFNKLFILLLLVFIASSIYILVINLNLSYAN